MQVFGDSLSGNCYKVKLLLHMMSLDFEWVEVNILAGETQTSEFLNKNPNGKIPLLVLDDGRYLSESNAILHYLASDHPLAGQTRFERAAILQWQFFEQYSHEPYIAVARFIQRYLGLPDDRREEYENKQQGGHKALQVMEEKLQHQAFLLGEQPTLADISLYAYTHVAEEGGFDLNLYPAIQRWLTDFAQLPGYLPME